MTGQHLQPDDAVQRDLPRAINDAHPAAAELAFYFVFAENAIAGRCWPGRNSRA
jgi:hypothetical protein